MRGHGVEERRQSEDKVKIERRRNEEGMKKMGRESNVQSIDFYDEST